MLTAIELTPLEETIFKTLVDAKEFSGCKTTIRVVGGWVRDKVLGLDSDDIDIALDDMSGDLTLAVAWLGRRLADLTGVHRRGLR